MKLKINKHLIALTLAGAMLSLTGCETEKENNEIAIVNEYNEINYDKELFKEIGISDHIVESKDFENIIKDLKNNNMHFEKTIVNGEKIISMINEYNEIAGAIVKINQDIISMSYKLYNAKNYDYVEKNCTYKFNNQGEKIGNMLTDNYFDIKNGTMYSITTTNDNIYMQAVTLKNEKKQELGISIGKPENAKKLLIVNNLELEVTDEDYNILENKLYKCGMKNNFNNFPEIILKTLEKYQLEEKDFIAYQKNIKA